VGPYGDAITKELIPYVEGRFRAVGQPWSRAMFGYSTGGWAALGMQILYPDYFNGAWSFCPDPVDFRATQIVNIYQDQNAFWLEGPFSHVPRPGERWSDGTIATTMDRQIRRELVLGNHGRSGEQWNIWQAVFGPVGEDGYPKPIWDPITGVIDHDVANYWREHYDLRFILERDWKTLGPKIVGKLHIATGTRDNFYLDNGVRLLEQFLETTNDPYYAGEVNYGPHYPHCYFGDPHSPAIIGELTYTETVLLQMDRWMHKSAPVGADLQSWKY
jgi:S-formylglutathione hydrolase FrmB